MKTTLHQLDDLLDDEVTNVGEWKPRHLLRQSRIEEIVEMLDTIRSKFQDLELPVQVSRCIDKVDFYRRQIEVERYRDHAELLSVVATCVQQLEMAVEFYWRWRRLRHQDKPARIPQ